MNSKIGLRKLAIVAIIFCAATPSTAQTSIPTRKPGLWEELHTSNLSAKPWKVLHCVGTGSDHRLDFEMGDASDEGTCSAPVADLKQGVLTLQRRCKVGKSSTLAIGIYKGRFDSSYEATFHTRITPPYDGHSELSGSIKARWLGTCPPGQRPGEMRSDTGYSSNPMEDRKKPSTPACAPPREAPSNAPRPSPAPC
jgi:hypothetical protein